MTIRYELSASVRQQPHCWIFAGPNGAGKTTFALNYLSRFARCDTFVNADLIASGLAPLSPESKSMAAGRTFLRQIAQHIDARRNFGFETTLAGLGHRRLIQEMQSDGWYVALIYLALPSLELAMNRVAERVRHGGHNVPEELIRRRYFRGLSNLFEVYADLVDHVVCLCNAGRDPIPVFQKYADEKFVTHRSTLRTLLRLVNHEFL